MSVMTAAGRRRGRLPPTGRLVVLGSMALVLGSGPAMTQGPDCAGIARGFHLLRGCPGAAEPGTFIGLAHLAGGLALLAPQQAQPPRAARAVLDTPETLRRMLSDLLSRRVPPPLAAARPVGVR
ncbi:hypothetical protein [Paracoccus thiocyanatus]|uniref:hypothetical protein n=1 Tax=Paracoccus thiocyanatus TaxID=34006 RepID=UPI0015F29310|nr:hypothetical protein [Paracoccus thiocyanatus]